MWSISSQLTLAFWSFSKMNWNMNEHKIESTKWLRIGKRKDWNLEREWIRIETRNFNFTKVQNVSQNKIQIKTNEIGLRIEIYDERGLKVEIWDCEGHRVEFW